MTDDAKRTVSHGDPVDNPVVALKAWVTPKVITSTDMHDGTENTAGLGSDGTASHS